MYIYYNYNYKGYSVEYTKWLVRSMVYNIYE